MKRLFAAMLLLLLLCSVIACAAQPAAQTPPAEVQEPAQAPASIAPAQAPVSTEAPAGDAFGEETLLWPVGDAGLRVPEFHGGEISNVLDNGDNCTVTVINAAEADYDVYVEELKEAGFTADPTEIAQAPFFTYSASSEDNYFASVSLSDGTVIVSAEFVG